MLSRLFAILPIIIFLSAGMANAQTSDIVIDGTFTYSSNINYASTANQATLIDDTNGTNMARFTIRDGGGAVDPDGTGTTLTALTLDLGPNWAMLKEVELRNAGSDAPLGGGDEQTVSGQTITWNALTGVATSDGGNLNFTVKVTFNDPVTDNSVFTFTISAATATGSTFAAANAGGATTTLTGDQNRIEVTATKLLFVQGPSNVVITQAMSPAVTIEAVDALDNRDLDNTSNIAVTSTGTLTGTPVTVAASSGLATFSTLTHTALATGRTLSATATSPSLTGVGPSSTFDVTVGTSNIILDGTFTHPANIAYQNFQEASDITNSGTSTVVSRFILQDGGGSSDADALPTVLTAISFNVSNSSALRRIALYDAAGTTELTGTAEVTSAGTINFSGLSLSAADNGNTTFTVRASFADPITDNTQFSLTVSAATAQAGNSQFAAANAGGAASSTTGDDNRIEVTATKLLFVQGPTNAFINVSMSPAVTLESVDALDNRDLDNTSTVAVTSTGTLTGSPVSVAAVNGLATFSTLQHSVAGTGLTLSATATVPALTGVGPSSTFAVSGGSDIIVDGTFTHPTNIAYQNFQEASDIVNSGTSTVIGRFVLRDGGGISDPDALPTVLTDLSFTVTNSSALRRIALFDGTTQLSGTSEVTAAGTINFTGLSFSAPDNGSITLTVRASFADPITDNTQFSLTVSSATAQGGNSQFASANAGGAATSTSGDDNRIEVTATKLLFAQGPSNVIVTHVMAPAVTVEAVDALDNRDLDNSSNVSVTSTGTLTGTPVVVAAASGLATFSTLTHTAIASGRTLSATAGGLTGTGASSTFDVTVGTSNIVLDGTFTHPANVAYQNFQEATDIVNSGTSTIISRFILQDGGGASDADGFPTVLTALSFNVTNSTALRRIALFDATGTTQLTGTAEVTTAGTINFSGLSLSAADNGNTTFTVRASFADPITDNVQFSLTVSSATAQAGNSQFNSTNAGGAASSTAGDDNRIEVTATKLLFIQGPSNVFVNVSMTPSVTIEAVDALDNRDLDNASNIAITSTGTLTGSPVTVAATAGLATFSTLQHSAAGTGLTLSATATGPVLTATPASNTFLVSGGSDIIIDPSFVYATNIDYQSATNQSASIGAAQTVIGRFTIRDGGGATDPGGAGTQLTDLTIDFGANFGMIKEVELWRDDDSNPLTYAAPSEKTVSAQTVSFTGLTGAGTLAADGATVSFKVRITFQQNVTDNAQVSATISAATATGSTFATANAGAATTSTAGDNNRIEVIASKLLYDQGPSNVFVNTAMTPAVTVEAVNTFNIRDLDNTSSVAITSDGTLSGSPVTVSAVNGVATFSSLIHTVVQTNRRISATATSPTLTGTGTSSQFNVVLAGSDIITNTTFTYPTNIAYDTYQEAGNIINSPTSIVVAQFDIRDGSGTTDADATATTLTNLTLDLGPNFGLIRRVALFDAAGTSQLAGTSEVAVASQTVAFSGLSLVAPDNGSITFSVRVSFQDPVTDNQQFSLTVTAATATGSTFSSANAGGATTSTAGDNNRIEVLATNLQFVQDPTDTYINVGMTPSVTVEAVDNLDNRDLDNTSNISISSTGTLVGTPVTVAAANGLATFPSLTHSAAGIGFTLTATSTVPVLTPGGSITFNILPPSNASDIVLNSGFTHPTNIAYDTHQEASNITNSGTSLVVTKFDIRDGGGAADGDPFSTVLTGLSLDLGPNFGLIRRIALYDAAGTTELTGTNEQAVAAQVVNFSGLNVSAADNGSTTFSVRVSFADPVTDNLQFSFTVTNTTTQAINSSFAAANAGGAVSSTAGDNNRIEVTATKLLFVQGPSSTFVNLNMNPAVTVEAVDALDNRDLDNTSTVTMGSTGSISGTTVQVAASGLATFAGIQHTAAGLGLTLSATSAGPVLTAAGPSTTFGISDGSDIAIDPAFVYNSNIPYNTHQESFNIQNTATSLVVARFLLRDGGAAPVDPDINPTELNSLQLDLGPNFNLIRRIALYDMSGSFELAAAMNEQFVGTQLITFNGLSLAAPDNGQVGFTVRVSFKSSVTDNQQFSFTVTSATAAPINSQFAAPNAGGATTSTAGDINRIEVTATNLNFVQQPTNTYVTVGMTPSVTVEAVDVLSNRDLDNVSSISITSSGILTGSPVTVSAVAGLATFPGLTHTVSAISRSLTASAPGLTNANSALFNVLPPSSNSNIIANGAFVYPTNIAYDTHQEAANIVNSGTSLNVARFDVQDGGGAADADGFPTIVTGITLNLGANFGLIRRIALYDAAGTAELAGTNEQAVAGPSVSFSGLTLTAPDNGSISFTVRVSFQDPVTDNQQFSFTVSNTTTQVNNSSFTVPSAGGATSSIAGDNNRIEVTATKLLFAQQPTTAYINVAMSPAVTVEAVDGLDNRDLDNASSVSITSTGTLTGSPVVVAATNGLATFSTLSHSVAQAGRTISATSTGPVLTTTGASSTFNILAPSNSSNIVLDGSFVHPTNIAYQNFQEPTNITSSGTSLVVGQFIVQDGGGLADGDPFPTSLTSLTLDLGPNFGLIRRIALYDAAGVTELTGVNEQAVSTQTVTFTGLSITAPDDGSTTFSVRVSFNAAVTDNLQFSVAVNNTVTVATNTAFASANAGGAVTSTASDNNRIEVTATQLRFTTNLNSPLLPAKDISAQQSVPVARAEDGLQNVDADYASSATINCALTVFPSINIASVGGVFTFASNFQYLQTGNGTINLTAPGLTNVISNAVTVQAGTATTITAGAAPPATISSLVNTVGAAVPVFNFVVNDDPVGTAGTNDDGLPTLITQIVITQNAANNTIPDWTQAIAGATLSDGTNTVNATAITATTITFGGISTSQGPPAQLGYIGDNGSKTYTMRIFLRSALLGALPSTIDGLKFEFQVLQSDVTLATSGSTNIIGGESETTGNANTVSVLASTLRFTSPTGPPVPITVSLDTDFPGIAVEAIDANNNRDLNYTSSITELTNVAGVTTTPVIVGSTFTAGTFTFPSNFRFTSGSSGANVTLSIKAGANTTCGPTTQCATSVALTLLSSSESSVIGDPTYSYSANIPYVQHQATNIDLTGSSAEIARMLLVDGSRTGFNYGGFLITTGTAVDGTLQGDDDGAVTQLNSITIRVSNPATLRRLALYSGTTELGEIDVDALNIADGTATQDFVFSGSPLLIAPNDGIVAISVRASFLNTAPFITDGDLINVSVADAVLGTGSTFYNSPPFIAGVNGGYQSPGGFNRLNVTATKLDFIQQPPAISGRNETIPSAAIVHARDQFNVLDTDFNTLPSSSIVTSQGPANVLGTFAFTAGVLNMNGLITYANAGVGTLTVTAGGLSSLTNQPAATPPNVAIQCNPVDVIHVTTTRQDGGAGGVPNGGPLDQVSLLAGSSDQVLFGFTFNAQHTLTGPNRPRVTRFTLSFNNSISGIFSNIRVFESTTGQFSVASQVPGANVTPGTQTIVDFSASPRDLVAFPNLTYFIMADVDPAVSGTTPNMKVSIIDGGLGSPTQNNIQIESNLGSQLANTSGPTFNFAAVAPPTLVDTYPRIGQTNLDPTQPTLEMSFSVPVFTLDQRVQLYRKGTPDVLVATLSATNGFPFAASGVGAAKPLIFNIPPGTLSADNEYYVLVASGNLSTNTGICDASRNLFPGISYPGTFFFRTASTVAPRLLGSATTPAASGGDPIATDITNNGATINATFDKIGKAYYLVCSTNNPTPPTNAEVISGIYPANTVVANGQFEIGATHTISQFGTFSVPAGFTAGTHYVWITAESFAEKKVGNVISQTGILAASPYGSGANNFAPIGGPVTGPTFNFVAPGPGPTPVVTTNNVTISMCSNSFQVLNNPIIIYEGTNAGQTFTSATPDQTINIVLPAGFQFDDTETSPGIPAYGKVDLIGSDFVGTGSITYLSTSVLRITFTNFGATGSKDQIVIRNLRIRSDGSRVGNVFRLGGSGIPAINDGTIMARLSAQEAPIISFDNSYSLSLGESWATTSFSETAIPDNAVPSLVTLTPYIPNAFDFGPTTFAGQGVNINTLNVNGVTLDVPFNITVTHTDQNGCISDNPVQFVVYDDARAIVITRPGKVNVPATIPINLDQGPYCSSIPTFQINQQIPSPAAPGVVRDVFFDNLDAYYMETLAAGIPATSVSGTHIINPTDFGGAWTTIVSGLPQAVGSQVINGYTFRDYQFDDKRIMNASAISGGAIPYVYDNFKVNRAPATPGNYPGGNFTFYNGGSLGFVEFTGTFRNIANPVVKINRRQIVEFYVPAVPMVELVTPYSDLITNDPSNPPSNIANPSNVNNPGTFVFCQAGGLITINGWPKAEPSQGTVGVFRIYNAAVGGSLITTGLTDVGNGIATIDPTDPGIRNGNNNIRIEYEYRDANSPNGTCVSVGSQVIRISPNPTASFTQLSQASPFVDPTNPSAYCEGKPIRFDASASSVSGGGATIRTYTWLFDDATNSVSTNPNAISGTAGTSVPGAPAAGTSDFPIHFYKEFNTYNPSLVIISNFNCRSVPATHPVKVGGIPEVKTVLDGTHVGPTAQDAFHFRSNNSVISSNDHFKRLDWNYGDGTTESFSLPPSAANDPQFNTEVFDHNYTSTGRKVYDLRVTTEIGCVNSLSLTNTLIKGLSASEDQILRTLVVLPRFIATPTNAYLETFEPATTNPNQIWQTWYTGDFTPSPIPPATTPNRSVDPSWELGVPVNKFTPTVNGSNIWATRLNGTYTSLERSAIYSPSFDLSALSRPMISFDTYTQLEAADGVVLQYSIDNKNIADPTKVWFVLGTENDGENWYTDRGIAAKPGDQVGNDYGWSQKNNNEWLSSRHALTDGSNAIITDPRVVFRLALASAATSIAGNGFGFDNVRIGERTRTILLESFGNTANTTKSSTTPATKTSDEQYESEVIAGFNASLVGLEVVKLNYRVNFPGNDPLNMNNPGDPSSRALFYNVDRTPAARLDGYAPTPYTPFSVWGQNTFDVRTLRLAQASLVIRPETGGNSNITSSGKIRFFVDVTPTVNLDAKTILHIGIVEQLVPVSSLSTSAQDMVETGETSFEYVVKKLLPSASGTRTSSHPAASGGVLVAPLAPAPPTTYTFGPFEWTPELNKFYSPSTGDLGVIAFLQREDGDKEVYQAEIVLSLDDPPSSLVTGVEPLNANDVKVYPNPANLEMTVQLPGALAKPAVINLIDQTGRTALQDRIQDGTDRKTLNVSDLSGGIYILTIDMGQGVLTRKKVMIVHQD